MFGWRAPWILAIGAALVGSGCGPTPNATGEGEGGGEETDGQDPGKPPAEPEPDDGKPPPPPDDPPDDDVPDHPPDIDPSSEWEQWLCLSLSTRVNRFAVNADGQILVAGRMCPWSSECDAYLARLDGDGAVQWVSDYVAGGSQHPLGVLARLDGDAILVGNTCDGDDCRPWIRRYDDDGKSVSHESLDPDTEVTDAVALGGGLLLAAETCPAGEPCSGWVRGTDLAGEPEWEVETPGVKEAAPGPDGDVWVLREAAEGNPGPGPGEVLVQRLGQDGTVRWDHLIDESVDDHAIRIEVGAAGVAHVLVRHRDGGGDEAGVFVFAPDGALQTYDRVSGGDVTPRDLALAPDGTFLVLASDAAGTDRVFWRSYDADGTLVDERGFTSSDATAGAIGFLDGGDLVVGAKVSELARIARYSL